VLEGKRILITGGTGTFGKECARFLLAKYELDKLIIFSRDELKQFEMSQEISPNVHPISFFIGDVTDKDRLYRAFDGIDYVIHGAAMKQVPASERNPFEAVKTNVLGAQNVIDAAIDRGVSKVIALSTDKAVNPINLYGATKLCSDKLFIAGNSYVGEKETSFSVVRYGNVMGSRGSVIPFFQAHKKKGYLPITDCKMTRFWITVEAGVELVISALRNMEGGELFVPKIPSMAIVDLAEAIAPECELREVGLRPGEKIHETLISMSDAPNTREFEDHYIVFPEYQWRSWSEKRKTEGKPVEGLFSYESNNNTEWLTVEQLRNLLAAKPSL